MRRKKKEEQDILGIRMVNSKMALHTVLFISRKKDNRHVENFKERRESFLTTKLQQIEKYLLCNAVKVHVVFKTYNNFGIITAGFDTRELLEKFPDVTLDRDGMRFVEAASLGLSLINRGVVV